MIRFARSSSRPHPNALTRELFNKLLPAGLILLSGCSATRAPGLAWWGELGDEAGSARHLIMGGIATDRFDAAPRIRVSIPADWRSAPREEQGGELVARLEDVSIEPVEGEPRDVSSIGGPVVVQRALELNGERPFGAKTVPAKGGAAYLIREHHQDETLEIDIIGFDGWPPVPVRLARFDWTISEDEARGWQEHPMMRGPAQLGLAAIGIGVVFWIADGGLGDAAEFSR
ncbi:MAG: hypothetical protein AAGG01_14415 [Planctomycetota bacterium]